MTFLVRFCVKTKMNICTGASHFIFKFLILIPLNLCLKLNLNLSFTSKIVNQSVIFPSSQILFTLYILHFTTLESYLIYLISIPLNQLTLTLISDSNLTFLFASKIVNHKSIIPSSSQILFTFYIIHSTILKNSSF